MVDSKHNILHLWLDVEWVFLAKKYRYIYILGVTHHDKYYRHKGNLLEIKETQRNWMLVFIHFIKLHGGFTELSLSSLFWILWSIFNDVAVTHPFLSNNEENENEFEKYYFLVVCF